VSSGKRKKGKRSEKKKGGKQQSPSEQGLLGGKSGGVKSGKGKREIRKKKKRKEGVGEGTLRTWENRKEVTRKKGSRIKRKGEKKTQDGVGRRHRQKKTPQKRKGMDSTEKSSEGVSFGGMSGQESKRLNKIIVEGYRPVGGKHHKHLKELNSEVKPGNKDIGERKTLKKNSM